MDPNSDVRKNNQSFIDRKIEELISHGSKTSDLELLELLLAGKPDASELLGCYHLRQGKRRLAADHFYDKMTPMPPICNMILRFVQAMTARGYDYNSMLNRLDQLDRLLDEEYVALVATLIADTDIDYKLVLKVTGFLICGFYWHGHNMSTKSMLDMLQVLCSAKIDPKRNECYLQEAVKWVISSILWSDALCFDEDLQSRLAALIGGLEAKNELLFSIFSFGDSLRGLQFLVDRCRCDPNYRNKDGAYVLTHMIKRMESGVVRFLLDCGAHPCVRNPDGIPAFKLFPNVIPGRVRTLQCIAASKIREHEMDYARHLPKTLHRFLELH